MMTSTLARSICFFFVTTVGCAIDHIEICLKELNQENLIYLGTIWSENPGIPLSIHINANLPQKIEEIHKPSFLQSIVGSGTRPNPHKTTQSVGSTKEVLLFAVQFLFGGGAISYFTTFYFIYRVYHIAKKIYSLPHFFGKEEEVEVDVMDELERILFRNFNFYRNQEDKQFEIFVFTTYLRIDRKLKDIGLRQLFPEDPYLDTLIVERVKEVKS